MPMTAVPLELGPQLDGMPQLVSRSSVVPARLRPPPRPDQGCRPIHITPASTSPPRRSTGRGGRGRHDRPRRSRRHLRQPRHGPPRRWIRDAIRALERRHGRQGRSRRCGPGGRQRRLDRLLDRTAPPLRGAHDGKPVDPAPLLPLTDPELPGRIDKQRPCVSIPTSSSTPTTLDTTKPQAPAKSSAAPASSSVVVLSSAASAVSPELATPTSIAERIEKIRALLESGEYPVDLDSSPRASSTTRLRALDGHRDPRARRAAPASAGAAPRVLRRTPRDRRARPRAPRRARAPEARSRRAPRRAPGARARDPLAVQASCSPRSASRRRPPRCSPPRPRRRSARCSATTRAARTTGTRSVSPPARCGS